MASRSRLTRLPDPGDLGPGIHLAPLVRCARAAGQAALFTTRSSGRDPHPRTRRLAQHIHQLRSITLVFRLAFTTGQRRMGKTPHVLRVNTCATAPAQSMWLLIARLSRPPPLGLTARHRLWHGFVRTELHRSSAQPVGHVVIRAAALGALTSRKWRSRADASCARRADDCALAHVDDPIALSHCEHAELARTRLLATRVAQHPARRHMDAWHTSRALST
jgi:hypothetical protein